MNKQAYRVIFNKNRGMLMAVAENVSVQGKCTGAGSESGSTSSPLLRFAHLAVAVSALFGSVTLVSAQIVADPNAASNRKPTVTSAPNGVPLVNIATPSSAGLSHNQFTSFSVDPKGVVLNNSATLSNTQTAGWVPGNANITPGNAARVILNEVTGTGISQLNGTIEVAGQRAEVVIANPNGLVVGGSGTAQFINTSRGVITTGTPVIGPDGSLQSLRVTRGDIQIGPGGLNGSNLDALDLFARSVAVNGQLLVNSSLNVIAGANLIGYADRGVQVIAGEGGVPAVAIDSSALGGMFANRIHLISTEAGVGVRSYAGISATAGDIDVDSKGVVTLGGRTTATGHVNINATDG
uniref:two-partner secretion domain-containing protein n=1 Tax=Collimonas humicola TaxID=2825886 RepID=UPI001B8B3245